MSKTLLDVMDELIQLHEKFAALRKYPEPGLSTWNSFVHENVCAQLKVLDDSGFNIQLWLAKR